MLLMKKSITLLTADEKKESIALLAKNEYEKKAGRDKVKALSETCRKIDLACLVAFPILFGVFIIVFCCAYV